MEHVECHGSRSHAFVKLLLPALPNSHSDITARCLSSDSGHDNRHAPAEPEV